MLLFLQIHLGMVDFDSSSSPPQRTLAEQKNESRNTIPFQMRITFDWSRSNANHRMQICSYWRLLLILFRWVHQEGRAQWATSLQMVGAGAENCLKEPTVQSCLVMRSSWSGVCIYHWCYHFLLIADWGSGGTVARAPSCPAQLTRGTPDHRHWSPLCYVRRTAAVGAGYLNKPSSTCWLQCGAWSCVVQPARALSAVAVVAVVALIVTTLMIPAQPSTSLLQWAGRHLADAQDTGRE